jgi:(E)-4-hydroxy-3-methylbut-2-enyl-diphosphate synthase
VNIGGVVVGGDAPVVVQSMTNTKTADVEATASQIKRLEAAGCEIARIAIPDESAAKSVRAIKERVAIPIVADIHFDHRLALAVVDQGVDALRINPGNIGGRANVREVVGRVRERKLPIRIGVNGGSVEKDLLAKHGGPTPQALVESALGHVRILEEENYDEIKISVKASSVRDTIEAYRLLSDACDYPLHVGVTEAGTLLPGAIKSALGIGMLLAEGIGDTIRVSLTADPVEEVHAAYHILASLGLRERKHPEVISCPTCGRLGYDMQRLVEIVEKRAAEIDLPITIAVMGCAVNGPGEARHADVGVAGGHGKGVVFRNGEIVAICPEAALETVLMEEIDKLLAEGERSRK